ATAAALATLPAGFYRQPPIRRIGEPARPDFALHHRIVPAVIEPEGVVSRGRELRTLPGWRRRVHIHQTLLALLVDVPGDLALELGRLFRREDEVRDVGAPRQRGDRLIAPEPLQVRRAPAGVRRVRHLRL